jgi:hypothetical protein
LAFEAFGPDGSAAVALSARAVFDSYGASRLVRG